MKNLLLSQRPSIRLYVLWAVGVACCFAGWTIGYHVLPEGALRGTFPSAAVVPDDSSLAATAWTIVLFNVLVGGGLIAAANLFRVGWFPLGYTPALAHWTIFGLLIGSNSFGVVGRRVAPSFVHLIGTIGFIEISALTFIASATTGLFMYRQRSWVSLRTTKVHSTREIRLSRCEILTVAVAVVLMVLAASREAISVMLA